MSETSCELLVENLAPSDNEHILGPKAAPTPERSCPPPWILMSFMVEAP